MSIGIAACTFLEPKEEELILMAEKFIMALGIPVVDAKHNTKIIHWYDDAIPSSYVVSTYRYVEPQTVVEEQVKARLSLEPGWIFKNAGDEWLMETLSGFNAFCATRVLANGEVIHSEFDNSIRFIGDHEMTVTLHYISPPSCLLEDGK